MDYLSSELKLPKQGIVQILVDMIIDRKIVGLIDEVKGVFVNTSVEEDASDRTHLKLLNDVVDLVTDLVGKNNQAKPKRI